MHYDARSLKFPPKSPLAPRRYTIFETGGFRSFTCPEGTLGERILLAGAPGQLLNSIGGARRCAPGPQSI